jgi:hypothetical protein
MIGGCNDSAAGVDTPNDPVVLADPRPGSVTGFSIARHTPRTVDNYRVVGDFIHRMEQ